MAPPERRLSAEAKPFAPPAGPTLAKVVSRDDDEQTPSPRRRGVIVDNMKVSYGFVRLHASVAVDGPSGRSPPGARASPLQVGPGYEYKLCCIYIICIWQRGICTSRALSKPAELCEASGL